MTEWHVRLLFTSPDGKLMMQSLCQMYLNFTVRPCVCDASAKHQAAAQRDLPANNYEALLRGHGTWKAQKARPTRPKPVWISSAIQAAPSARISP